MINRGAAWLAFAVLAAFLGILAFYVARIDLSVIIGLTLVLAFWDLWLTAGERAAGGGKHKE